MPVWQAEALSPRACGRSASVEVQLGSAGSADLVIRSGPDLKRLMAGDVTPAAALKEGLLEVSGPRELLTRFAQTFRI